MRFYYVIIIATLVWLNFLLLEVIAKALQCYPFSMEIGTPGKFYIRSLTGVEMILTFAITLSG